MMFRRLPPQGGDARAVAEVVNNMMDGKTNNTGSVTLATGDATSTTIYNERISPDSVIIVIPTSDAAETDATPYGSFQDLADQNAAAANTEYQVTYNTTDFANGISVVSSSRLTVKVFNLRIQTRKLMPYRYGLRKTVRQ
jgi:Na+-transporting NADH:ubiquinone oxidoreductase subunit NqrA